MINTSIRNLVHLRQKPTLSRANRAPLKHEQWLGIWQKFFLQTLAGGLLFVLLFLGCLSYLYGTLYKSYNKHHNMHFLYVDYDGGVIGQSVQAAYKEMAGPTFPTLYLHTPQEFPNDEDVVQSVRRGDYWGAIYSNAGASDRLSTALQGGGAAQNYNAQDALTFVWNQQAYTTFADSVVQASMQQLVAATRIAYTYLNGTSAFSAISPTSTAAITAFLNPIDATETNIKPTPGGSSIFFNSVSMVVPVLQQFFFLLVLNGTCRAHSIYSRMTIRSSLLIRRLAGLLYTFLAALCQTGYFWAFGDGWQVNGSQFVLTWLTFWLLMHIHLCYLDAISSIAPLPVMPFILLIWIFFNISATVSPLVLQPGFYHWGAALPSNNAYSVLITIWTGGADRRLYRNLPVLFSWWVVGNVVSAFAHLRACHLAYKLEHESGAGFGAGVEKGEDEEAQVDEASEHPEAAAVEGLAQVSRQSTLKMEGKRTLVEEDEEQREIYGPSILPMGWRRSRDA